jgi:CRP-like cAMP-binding protein
MLEYKKTKGTFTLRRMFPSLQEKDIALLQENSSVIRLRKTQNLFISGDTPRNIYGLANGCLKIVRESQEGESVITRIVRPGQVLGIREVFGDFKYSRTAVALKDSEAFSISSSIIFDLLGKSPQLAMHFIKVFCHELSKLEKRLESDVYVPAKNRVGTVIYDLYHLFAEEGVTKFEPPLNRKDIADLADVTPETVSRSIAQFKTAGLIETRGQAFHIINLDAFVNEIDER